MAQQTGTALSGDWTTIFALYASFVNQMMRAKVGIIVYIWASSWAVAEDQVKTLESGLSADDSWAIFSDYKTIWFICTLVLVPLFGFLMDRVNMWLLIMLAFGMRAVASLAFYGLESPEGDLVVFTFIVLGLCSSI